MDVNGEGAVVGEVFCTIRTMGPRISTLGSWNCREASHFRASLLKEGGAEAEVRGECVVKLDGRVG